MLVKILTNQISKIASRMPLRLVLILPFVLQIFAAVGLVGYFSVKNGRQAVNNVASQLRSEANARIKQHLDTYLATPHVVNQINKAAIDRGILDINDFPTVSRYFWDQLQALPNVSFLDLGTEQGQYIGVERLDSGEFTVEIKAEDTGEDKNVYAVDRQGNTTNQKVGLSKNYDPRLQSWYKAAKQSGQPTWTKIYQFSANTAVRLGMGFVQPIYDQAGNLRGVLGASVVLTHLSDFLHSLKIGQSGQTFIIERDGLLVASSNTHQPFAIVNGVAQRLKAADSKDVLVSSTAAYLTTHFGSLSAINRTEQIAFTLGDQLQFVQIYPLQDDRGIDWLIVVVVPESDFTAQIDENTRTTILLCGLALLVAALISMIIARWITQSLAHLSSASQTLIDCFTSAKFLKTDLDLNVKVQGTKEIRVLAQLFNQMADQLLIAFITSEHINETLEIEVLERTKALTATESELRGLIAAMTELIMVINSQGCCLRILRTDTDVLYKPVQEQIGKTLHEIFPKPQADQFLAYIHQVLDTKQPLNIEYSLIIAEKEVWSATTISPIGDDSVMWVVRDISDRKQSEEALRLSEAQYRDLVQMVDCIIIRWDAHGYIRFLNNFGQKFFGYQEHEIVGKHVVNTIVPETESSGRDLQALMNTRCATKKGKNSQPRVLENRTNAISGENYVFYGIFYHCGLLQNR